MRWRAALILGLLLTGCPGGPSPARRGQGFSETIVLSFGQSTVKVGQPVAATVMYLSGPWVNDAGPVEGGTHPVTDRATLSSDPEGAVAWDPARGTLTCARAGKVTVWATAAGGEGAPLRSADVTLDVTE